MIGKNRWLALPRLVAGTLALLTIAGGIAIVALQSPRFFERQLPPPVTQSVTPTARVVASSPKIAPPKSSAAPGPSDFENEQRMSFGQLMTRWNPIIVEASNRFDIPQSWIRAVMQLESGGRTTLGESQPITSSAGAMGLMQVMPSTYEDMRAQHGLGADPYDPHDNILAGAAYLRWLREKYPYPALFAAYNDGPGNLEERLVRGGLLPAETRNYVSGITLALHSGGAIVQWKKARFTAPDGSPVWIDGAAGGTVRAALPDEYAPGVQSVITVGRLRQGVRETVVQVRAIIRAQRSKT